jgi:hypothetical protein
MIAQKRFGVVIGLRMVFKSGPPDERWLPHLQVLLGSGLKVSYSSLESE